MGLDVSDLSRLPQWAQQQILKKTCQANAEKSANIVQSTQKRSKYGAVKTWVDGLCFDSKLEAAYYGKLKLLHRAGALAGFLHHNRMVLAAGTDKEHRALCYEPDFILLYPDGHYEIVDTKGVETAQFRDKQKLLRERYPGVVITLETEAAYD